jgi:hypothetical protein
MRANSSVLFRFAAILLSAVPALAVSELAARRLSPAPVLTESFPCRDLRPELGGGFLPDCRCRWSRWMDGRLVFSAGFQTDHWRRRVTPQTGTRPGLALFFGCSFTLGAGVEQGETMPADFARLAPDYQVLNYAGSGFGPGQALVLLQTMTTEEIPDYGGAPLAVYTMIPGHVARAAGYPSILGSYGRHFPSFALTPIGGLTLEGPFAVAHPWRVRWAEAVEGSALLRRIPERQTDADVDLTARLVLAAAQTFQERFPGGRFVVLAYPGEWTGTEPVLARMRDYGLRVLDPEGLVGVSEPGMRLLDRHPTPESYRRVAAWLADELRAK